jgi:hypothetical protein
VSNWLAAWRRSDGSEGHSLARLERVDDGWVGSAHEVVVSGPDRGACAYTVRLDREWRTRTVHVEAVSTQGLRTLDLHADEDRRWWRYGEHRPELEGCLDVDVAAAPFTNTFPIRRLAELAVGKAATFPVAWVDVPSLEVERDEQTYRRLGAVSDPPAVEAWEYGDPRHGTFRLTVDANGLVVDYEGLATRIR